MTAKILVVDDVPANVRLLEAKLIAEYYDVVTAEDGFQAIEKAQAEQPDIILLDVMMPGMDGFECCRKLKADPTTGFIPVVMVTALSDVEDRIKGLDAGADDFLTKPINDVALMARVKSLVRTKMLLDELRLRDQTGMQMGVAQNADEILQGEVTGARVLLVDDDYAQVKRIKESLAAEFNVDSIDEPQLASNEALNGNYDVIIISTMLDSMDGLRLASQMKSQDMLRHIPILILVDEFEQNIVLKGLEMGINDYLVVPADASELSARVKTQAKRKRYQQALRSNYHESISLAVKDGMTGLYNRNYLDAHLENMVKESLAAGRPLSLALLDMDHFKSVNDNYGHNCGDEVLKELANRISSSVRGSDLPARFGGEEFMILMPGTRIEQAIEVAERTRQMIEGQPFKISHEAGQIDKTASFGVSTLNLNSNETGEELIKRADAVLYDAKENGRNQVCVAQ